MASNASLERLLKRAGAERVSAPAIEAMAEVVNDYGMAVARQAVELARHAGRKTVQRDDVKLAARNWR